MLVSCLFSSLSLSLVVCKSEPKILRLVTQHLISYPFLKVAHNTKEYAAALRQDFTFESRDRKSFQNVKIKSFTIGQDRQHTLQREAAFLPAQIQFQSALKQLSSDWDWDWAWTWAWD